MARVSFTVEGLANGDEIGASAREEIVRALAGHGFQTHFEPASQTFSVDIDPAVNSFSDVRRAIGAVGKLKGRVYIAVVMSP